MEENEIFGYVESLCKKVKENQSALGSSDGSVRNAALISISEALIASCDEIIAENKKDLEAAEINGVQKTMIDRLTLTPERIKSIADSVIDVAKLPDPLGNGSVTVRPNGLRIMKTAVPIGTVGMIYEARPNVTVDAAVLCLKSGNCAVLRGGKEAINTNRILMKIMKDAIRSAGLCPDCVALIDDTSRKGSEALMKMRGLIDVLIPRGGKGLIKSVVQNSEVPVIETGAGNCHIYIDEFADLGKALKVAVNAKVSRPSVCNAVETMLVHSSVAEKFLPGFYDATRKWELEIRGCEKVRKILPDAKEATEEDYDTEYNDYIISVKAVDSLEEAIAHIKKYSTGHSEAIITENYSRAKKFCREIDCAAVYVNASTRFTDGGEFGLGAEIGISTQKIHARGPMGLSALTTSKYIVEGDGQIR